ncbi:DgyrCDS12750 [Dimorphilus gyrociliatus]|uniref:cAMP-dependent protein kinase type II regulatory subunit n=1 Tax=Dimorphilus gyrociliatus TaxID=2664684 RepID=A0A7I8W7Z7_9ANNE|nr:DgyrCDS12750 [Dimorphilus gyrociliatus]
MIEMQTSNHSMNLEIPEGLGDMLRDFTVSVLRQRPSDLFDFAAEYFEKARQQRRAKSVPMYIIVDDENEAQEPDPAFFKPKSNKKGRFARRQSVSAERYDPEADEDDEKVVHPKTDEQRDRLAEAVQGILIFRSLDTEQMQDVLDAMFEKRVDSGQRVIEQGDDGDNFYVIDHGTFDVLVTNEGQERKVHEFVEKGSFGEMALLYNMPRSATVVAKTVGSLWAMDRNSFRRIVLKSTYMKRKLYEELLDSVPMLKSLTEYERMSLADALVTKSYNDGDCIIKEGDQADGMYFIEDGKVKVLVDHKGKGPEEVARQSKGKYFGEMALVEQQPRSASVYALGKVKCAFVDRDSFERLLGPCLDIMKRNIEQYQR